MNSNLLPLLFLLLLTMGCSRSDEQYALIETPYGDIKVLLYNETPKHRDNFVKLVKEGFYDSLLFHRTIQNFMIQGGDPQSRAAAPGQVLGMGGPGYRIDPEIGAPHFRGTLAAARNQDPDKKSSGSQFYIVQGRPVNDQMLAYVEQQNNVRYNDTQRQLYKERGGTPDLDGNYTVFGEVVEGMEVVDRITTLQTDSNDRPLEDVRFTIRMID